MRRAIALALVIAGATSAAGAQWLGYPAKNIPRTAAGKPILSAPAPRTADGKPDLSGVWQPTPEADGPAGGIEGIRSPKYMVNVMRANPTPS